MSGTILVFLFLQVLDFLTSYIGLQLGIDEANPSVRLAMWSGAVTGLIISKLIAAILGAVCTMFHKTSAITKINYFFAALVIWNLGVISSRLAG